MKQRTSATCLFLAACAACGQSIELAYAQRTSPAARAAFEVASVKPCRATDNFNGSSSSPGRFTMSCIPVITLISMAYIEFGSGQRDPFSTIAIEGAPGWIEMSEPASNWYAIDARAEGAASEETMRGPMMQALLEDRFKLRVHRETRNARIYPLTVVKGGAKMRSFDGSCTPRDYTKATQPQPEAGQKPLCERGGLTRGGRRRWICTGRIWPLLRMRSDSYSKDAASSTVRSSTEPDSRGVSISAWSIRRAPTRSRPVPRMAWTPFSAYCRTGLG